MRTCVRASECACECMCVQKELARPIFLCVSLYLFLICIRVIDKFVLIVVAAVFVCLLLFLLRLINPGTGYSNRENSSYRFIAAS